MCTHVTLGVLVLFLTCEITFFYHGWGDAVRVDRSAYLENSLAPDDTLALGRV